MSKPKHYWYGFVKNNIIGRLSKLDTTLELENSFVLATARAIDKTQELNNPEDRLEAIKAICINKTDTVESLSMRKYWSERTVRGWTNDFVNMVGEEAGFPVNK